MGIIFNLFSSAAILSEVWGWLNPYVQGVIIFYAIIVVVCTAWVLRSYRVTVRPELPNVK
jgi:high-affinity Fe2+/Pb2+ permease